MVTLNSVFYYFYYIFRNGKSKKIFDLSPYEVTLVLWGGGSTSVLIKNNDQKTL